MQSEDLPHSSGIKTIPDVKFDITLFKSEDLPHSSGIKTVIIDNLFQSIFVGRLAPLIGD